MADMSCVPDLSVEVAGIKMKNPLVLSEGPLSGSARLIERAARHNMGAIVTKSVRMEPSRSENPYMIAGGHGLINADWTDVGFDAWLGELDKLHLDIPLFTNVGVNYCKPKKAAELAEELQKHGASFVTFSDYEPENLVEVVRYTKKAVDVPIMVKLPPFVKNIGDLCKRLEDAEVNMIAAMDAVGPAMDIDLKSRSAILGSDGSFGYLSSTPIFPLTLAYIAEIAAHVSVPVLGVGGVSTAADVVKLIMAGATCVGIVGTAILKGLSVFDRIEAELRQWMIDNTVRSLSEIRGCAQPSMHREPRKDLRARVIDDRCTGCGQCVTSCYAAALKMENGRPAVNYGYCSGCGVCESICHSGAIMVRAS
jgi:dihydroorotate dehydrogenase/Pyruvate/2-oxoacid:ferredoxin oxidoreductase delta subunit